MAQLTHAKPVADLIRAAIAIFGSEAKLGAATGYSQNAIWAAKRAGRVSAEMAAAIDAATNGVVSKERLRADLFQRDGVRASVASAELKTDALVDASSAYIVTERA